MDVRKESEYLSERLTDAFNLPLSDLNSKINTIDKHTTYHIHCAGGYRSVMFISILKARGFENLIDVAGGFKAIAETSASKTEYVCPSTL